MTLYFMGSFYPKHLHKEIKSKSCHFDFAGDILQQSILNGLHRNNIYPTTITVPATKNLAGLVLKSQKYIDSNSRTHYLVGFYDVPILKEFITSIKVKKILSNSHTKVEYMLIYSLTTANLFAAYNYKKSSPTSKIIVIITDLPQYMNPSINPLFKVLKKIQIIFFRKYLSLVDGFVLLTKQMSEVSYVKDKPFIVIEGIYNNQTTHKKDSYNSDINQVLLSNKTKTVLYTGSLSKRYGIINLIEAFKTLDNSNYRLLIFGEGDSKQEIINNTKEDKRIIFGGVLDQKQIIEYQKSATLLVNPRTSEGEYTKYSFPSKTIEYLASGTPSLIYRLPGIPQEYYNYCFSIKNKNKDLLAIKIQEILSMPTPELKAVGEKAKAFILNNKNSFIQTKKIIDFMKIL